MSHPFGLPRRRHLAPLLQIIDDENQTSDGGGVVKAALNPIYGRDKVLRFLQGVRPEEHRVRYESGTLNGAPALLVHVDGVLDTVVATRVHGGLITELYVMRNPQKLHRVDAAVSLKR
ncbi:MAG TPA: hypothetical protein VHG09_10700 [Longimicrobiales bacterium]|nr:hypothetical protein [Longimicrobiales bacterium]